MPWWIAVAVLWLMVAWGIVRVVKAPGPFQLLKRLVGVLVTALTAVALSAILTIRHVFHVFVREEVIANVAVQRLGPSSFTLTYDPVAGEPVVATLEGDQWAVTGGIIKWAPWVAVLGLRNYHKPMRVSGQYSRLEEQRRHLPSIQPLVPGAMDRFWEALYRLQPYVPFVDAVYGSSAYVYAEPGASFRVYVSPTGYLIKRVK